MRKAIIFLLVAMFVMGALALVGCKKKETPTAATPATATVAPTAAPTPVPTAAPTATTAKTAEKPTAEKKPAGK